MKMFYNDVTVYTPSIPNINLSTLNIPVLTYHNDTFFMLDRDNNFSTKPFINFYLLPNLSLLNFYNKNFYIFANPLKITNLLYLYSWLNFDRRFTKKTPNKDLLPLFLFPRLTTPTKKKRIVYGSGLYRRPYKSFLSYWRLLKKSERSKKHNMIPAENYVLHPQFNRYRILMLNSRYKLKTPQVRVRLRRFEQPPMHPLFKNKTTKKFFKTKKFLRDKKQTNYRRAKFLNLLVNLAKSVRVIKLKGKYKISLKRFMIIKKNRRLKNTKKHHLFPRQYSFLNSPKKPNLRFNKSMGVKIFRRVCVTYKRRLRNFSTKMNKSRSGKSRSFKFRWRSRTLPRRVRFCLPNLFYSYPKTLKKYRVSLVAPKIKYTRKVRNARTRYSKRVVMKVLFNPKKVKQARKLSFVLRRLFKYYRKSTLKFIRRRKLKRFRRFKAIFFKKLLKKNSLHKIVTVFKKTKPVSNGIKKLLIRSILRLKPLKRFIARHHWLNKQKAYKRRVYMRKVKRQVAKNNIKLSAIRRAKYRYNVWAGIRNSVKKNKDLVFNSNGFESVTKMELSKLPIKFDRKIRRYKYTFNFNIESFNNSSVGTLNKLSQVLGGFSVYSKLLNDDNVWFYRNRRYWLYHSLLSRKIWNSEDQWVVQLDLTESKRYAYFCKLRRLSKRYLLLKTKIDNKYRYYPSSDKLRRKTIRDILSKKLKDFINNQPMHINNNATIGQRDLPLNNILPKPLVKRLGRDFIYRKLVGRSHLLRVTKTMIPYLTNRIFEFQNLRDRFDPENHLLIKQSFINNHFREPYIISKTSYTPKTRHNIVLNHKSFRRGIFINSNHKVPFIFSNFGFLFVNSGQLYSTASRFLKNPSIKPKINKYRYSFFYKNDIKRLYLRRPGRLKMVSSLLNQKNFFKNKYLQFNIFKCPTDPISGLVRIPGEGTVAGSHLVSSYDKLLYNNYFRDGIIASGWPVQNKIKRIRFKPGYSRIWRKAREAINYTLRLNVRYQYRLSRRLHRLKYTSTHFAIKLTDWNLGQLVLNSRFVFDLATSTLLIKSNLVFVNGNVTINPNLILYVGDFIQLIVSLKFYIVSRWLINWNLHNKLKLNKLSRSKNNKSRRDMSKQKSNHLPDWIFTIGYKQVDIPKYLEVDYFTLSSFIIYEANTINNLSPLIHVEARPTILNMYNWKYIN